MSEVWDAYDNSFNKIEDLILVRGEVIPDGVYHLVGEIIVKHTDDSYLLMQRDFIKLLGGMWELTAGGSALRGENPLECAIRELKEETGIKATELEELDRIEHEEHQTLYVEYLGITDCEKDAIILQKDETIAYKWIQKSELLNMEIKDIASSRAMKLIREQNL